MSEQVTAENELTDAQKNYEHDRSRLRTRKIALLELLRDGHWHPNYELMKVGGLSFNSYLYQLRNAGWQIESRRIRGGVWQQRLTGRGIPRSPRGLSSPQRRVADEVILAVRKVYGEDGWKRISSEFSPWLLDALAAR